MSTAARKRAEDAFDINKIVPMYENYYQTVRERSMAEA
jgi:hypothetical protein